MSISTPLSWEYIAAYAGREFLFLKKRWELA
jgi:hypothetical protein